MKLNDHDVEMSVRLYVLGLVLTIVETFTRLRLEIVTARWRHLIKQKYRVAWKPDSQDLLSSPAMRGMADNTIALHTSITKSYQNVTLLFECNFHCLKLLQHSVALDSHLRKSHRATDDKR